MYFFILIKDKFLYCIYYYYYYLDYLFIILDLFLDRVHSPLHPSSISCSVSMSVRLCCRCVWEYVLPDVQYVPVVVELQCSSCVISSQKSSGMIRRGEGSEERMEKHSESIPATSVSPAAVISPFFPAIRLL